MVAQRLQICVSLVYLLDGAQNFWLNILTHIKYESPLLAYVALHSQHKLCSQAHVHIREVKGYIVFVVVFFTSYMYMYNRIMLHFIM